MVFNIVTCVGRGKTCGELQIKKSSEQVFKS